MSSIIDKIYGKLYPERTPSIVSRRVAQFIILESFKDRGDAGPADLSVFTTFNEYYGEFNQPGEEVDGVRIIGPVEQKSDNLKSKIYDWEDESGFPND